MKKSTSIILIVSFSLVLFNCAGTFKQKSSFPGIPYSANGFKTQGTTIGFITPSSSYGLEQDKWILLKILSDTIKKRNGVTIVSPNKCLSLINRARLAKQYTEMIRGHIISGILEKETLSKIGRVIGVNYFLHLRLTGFDQSVHTRFSLFSLRLINSQQAKMRASIQIWEAKNGVIVWESQVENIISIEALRARPVSFERIAKLICEKFTSELP